MWINNDETILWLWDDSESVGSINFWYICECMRVCICAYKASVRSAFHRIQQFRCHTQHQFRARLSPSPRKVRVERLEKMHRHYLSRLGSLNESFKMTAVKQVVAVLLHTFWSARQLTRAGDLPGINDSEYVFVVWMVLSVAVMLHWFNRRGSMTENIGLYIQREWHLLRNQLR